MYQLFRIKNVWNFTNFYDFSVFTFLSCKKELKTIYHHNKAPVGIVLGKIFLQGAKDTETYAVPREKPATKVNVDDFLLIL